MLNHKTDRYYRKTEIQDQQMRTTQDRARKQQSGKQITEPLLGFCGCDYRTTAQQTDNAERIITQCHNSIRSIDQ